LSLSLSLQLLPCLWLTSMVLVVGMSLSCRKLRLVLCHA
jgi:hypothetical protein